MATTAGSWRTSLKPAVIVAESLRRVPGPPLAAPPPVHGSPGEVASAIAHGLTPPLATDVPPEWLLPGQSVSFARALAAIRRHGAALIADPVGSGKTWIALALAKTLAGGAVAIVPAALRKQWERAARRTGVAVRVQTHEEWSRARRPIPEGLVVVDEAHWYRHADTKRYAHLAPALVGRDGVLLTATPVVNRMEDVVNELLLLARDDALAGAGVASIREMLSHDRPPPQLAELIIAAAEMTGRPTERARQLGAAVEEEEQARAVFAQLDRLVLSTNRAVRTLLAGVFAAAWGSSPAALRATLSRYRTLLLQERDAAGEGLCLGRQDLRRLLGGDLAQTVLWPVIGDSHGSGDLVAGDLPALEELLAWLKELDPGTDPKIRRLNSVLGDGSKSIVFTTARATVGHLRRVLAPTSRIAWCTGAEAGIGATRLSRADVLQWFGPEAPEHELAPQTLVATDVAAEGLDLQRAGRIVHYDLPWTTVRLDQRAGRVVRLGSRHTTADVVTLLPPAAVEARLNLLQRLARKRPLPSRLGLGR
ncbi:MAG TPA: DEAD/DEAH box helicase, partial [Gemmatimonadales bacterium]